MPLVFWIWVKPNSLHGLRAEVGSADVVAERIASIEKQKDGNFSTEIISAKDVNAGDIQTYLIDYRCDTSRGPLLSFPTP